jgi:hypothetical protein
MQPEKGEDYPTVLIASGDETLSHVLVSHLRQDNCLILEAASTACVLDVITRHSRPIHVLLAEIKMGGPALADVLRKYRPSLQVFFVSAASSESRPGVLSVSAALAKTRGMLRVSK